MPPPSEESPQAGRPRGQAPADDAPRQQHAVGNAAAEGVEVQAAAAASGGGGGSEGAADRGSRDGSRSGARGGPVVGPLAAVLVAAAAGAAGAWAVARWRRRRGGAGAGVQRAAVGKQHVYAAVLALHEPSVPLPPPSSAATAGLAGLSLVLSDRLDVQALETRFGCDAWKEGSPTPAPRTYYPADVLVAAGVTGAATVLSEPLGLGPLLSPAGAASTPNPAGRGCTHGGGDFGAAVAVAAGLADMALAVDELGTARVPAACCGAYALRCSAGVLPLEGAAAACASLAAPALLAGEPGALLKAGQALRLPGGGAPTEVLSYLVAEDFFAACGEEAKRMVPAVVAAVKRWAGPDQAQALSLCEWLYHRVASLAAFLPPQAEQAANEADARQQRGDRVLAALADAAEALQRWEFAQRHGPWVEAHQAQLPAEVVQFWQEAQQLDGERYRRAQAVAGDMQAALRDALRDGYIFVLPTTPGPAPPADADPAALAGYRRRCLQFASVAALSGAPSAALPLPQPGGLPLSVSLLALHKRDLALLQAAVKLGPLLAEEAAALAAAQAPARRRSAGGGEQPPWQPRAAVEAAKAAAGGSAAAAGSNGRARGRGGKAPPPEQAAAEARKEEGNAAFKAGRYEEAARQYSAAIQLYPKGAVYYNNRAMAYLKLGAYGAAEADCDAALKLELSAKALLRRGSARLAQGNAAGAQADFRQVLALEPHNRQAREELRGIEALMGPEGDLPGGLQAGAVF